MQLHLGCGRSHLDGWVNCDYIPGPTADMVFDVQEPWPIKDDAATAIYASHMLEHLTRPHDFFREAWRVLVPNGQMLIRVPFGGSRLAWCDLTHIRPWYAETFCMLQPGYSDSTGNPQHDEWSAFFGISVAQHRLRAELAPTLRSWWRRRLLVPWLRYMTESVQELHVHLFALKRPEDVTEYRRTHAPEVVPCSYVMYRHDWEGRARLKPGEPAEVMDVPDAYGVRL